MDDPKSSNGIVVNSSGGAGGSASSSSNTHIHISDKTLPLVIVALVALIALTVVAIRGTSSARTVAVTDAATTLQQIFPVTNSEFEEWCVNDSSCRTDAERRRCLEIRNASPSLAHLNEATCVSAEYVMRFCRYHHMRMTTVSEGRSILPHGSQGARNAGVFAGWILKDLGGFSVIPEGDAYSTDGIFPTRGSSCSRE